ncbi:MAG TPA: LD-carboxypeptidase [Candidatus Binatia bacterium]
MALAVNQLKTHLTVQKPPCLRPGARIGVVAPAGKVDRDELEAGIAVVRAEGFEVELGANLFGAKGYLAGDPQSRARDLVDFFQRSDIDAIFCARGGFGSIQLLPYLSTTLQASAKIFVGYSDITILLNWLRQFRGMVTFHAPMLAMDLARGLSAQSRSHFWPLLTGELKSWKTDLTEVIRPGFAEGDIIGGCLSLLVTTLGTPYEIDTVGKVLFLEDVGEKPYRIERMMTQLLMAGKLDRPAGVLFGDFTRCDDTGPRDFREIVTDVFRHASYPVVMGMRAGHGDENLALPFGARMALDGEHATLELLESPVR